MRVLASLLLLSASAFLLAQESLFSSVKPDAWITVRRHAGGTDLVEITMQDPKYPADLLREQVRGIGKFVGVDPWGIQVTAETIAPGVTAVRASFAVNDLTNDETGDLRLGPLAKGFASDKVRYLSVVLANAKPSPHALRAFNTDAVRIESRADEGEIGLEYRLEMKTSDPEKIDIPDAALLEPKTPEKPKQEGGGDWLVWTLIGLAAVAVGALVYSLLLRPRPRPSG